MSDSPAEKNLTLAKHIHVSRSRTRSGAFDLEINGEPFPYYLAGDKGAEIIVSTNRMPAVTLTILAEHVTMSDELDDESVAIFAEHSHDEDTSGE